MNQTRQRLLKSGNIKPAAKPQGVVQADPNAVKARAHEALAQKTARALAILRAAGA